MMAMDVNLFFRSHSHRDLLVSAWCKREVAPIVWTPDPQAVEFPVLLNDPRAPTLKAYPVFTVIAEKHHAMTILGLADSRMMDFFDIAAIARRADLDGATLARVIGATFARHVKALPTHPPVDLAGEFA